MRPTVGLMPTSIVWLAGVRIEPDVSVPTLAAQKFAAVPAPELDPPAFNAGRPSLRSLARIRPWIVGIESIPDEPVVIAGHPGRHPICELRHVRLRDDDGARIAKVLRQRRLVRRHEPLERQRAAGRRHVGRVDVVFQRNRDAVQRSAYFSLRALAIARVGFIERSRVERDDGVQPVFVLRNAIEILLDDAARRDAPLRHRGLHV